MYNLIADGKRDFRKSALPDSRSFVICAERLGFTGTGGGGEGVSRVRSWRWRVLRRVSSSWRARELDDVDSAFDWGSRWRGSWVKVSGSSMSGYGIRGCALW